MNIFLHTIIFIMGTFFGSFFTLAVYRIPLKKDITHEHSFCPNCNHKLGVFDLVPVFSYLFLKGKCRYCGEKVRIRYLLLEVLSGFVFLLAFLSYDMANFETLKIVEYCFFVLFYVNLVLVAGIDKEYQKINFSVLGFAAICQMLYILYLYIIKSSIVYRYSIYFAIFVGLFALLAIFPKTRKVYGYQVLVLCAYIVAVLGIKAMVPIWIGSLIIICILPKEKKTIGFAIALSTIGYKIVDNFLENYDFI